MKTILQFFLMLLLAADADAQTGKLKDIQEKFNSASTISADISQKAGGPAMNGKIYLKKENKLRIEFRNSTIISDGVTIWNHNKKEDKVIISSFDANNPSAWSFDKIINEYPGKSEVKTFAENGKEAIVLRPDKNSGLSFDSVTLWPNEDNLIDKVKIEQSGSTLELNITNYELNTDIPESRFTFTPPAGTQVIDLR